MTTFYLVATSGEVTNSHLEVLQQLSRLPDTRVVIAEKSGAAVNTCQCPSCIGASPSLGKAIILFAEEKATDWNKEFCNFIKETLGISESELQVALAKPPSNWPEQLAIKSAELYYAGLAKEQALAKYLNTKRWDKNLYRHEDNFPNMRGDACNNQPLIRHASHHSAWDKRFG